MSRQTRAELENAKGRLTVSNHDSDAPILPIGQIEQLHKFRPDLVNWMFDQTKLEAEDRRREVRRINTFTFIEHLIGQVFALLIGVAGIGGGVYAAINGQPLAGGTIATAAITGLAVVFVKGRSAK